MFHRVNKIFFIVLTIGVMGYLVAKGTKGRA